MTQDEVYALIQGERRYQQKLWPGPAHKHSYREYLIYVRDYLAEALHNESRFLGGADGTKAIVRKVAAMCLAATEENSPEYMTNAYLSIDIRRKSQPLTLWIADMAVLAEEAFLGLSPSGYLVCNHEAIHLIYRMAFHCMEEHGAPARDVEGDLAKRQRTA